MKKFLSLILVLCMTATFVPMAFAAEGEVVIDATEDVVTFYDNGMNGGNGTMEIFYENLMLRQCGEWVTYDISDLAAGTYSVAVTYKMNGNVVWKRNGLDFAVDDGLELRTYLSHTGAWDGETATVSGGKIYVPDGAQSLKVKNHGMYSINLDLITLTYEGEEDTSEDVLIYGQNSTTAPNSENNNSQAYIGVDYWDAATGEDAATYTEVAEDGSLHLPITSGSILSGATAIIHHTDDWTRYDISDFKSGTYEVTLNRDNRANTTYSFEVDGEVALTAALEKTADAWGTYADAVVGKIWIEEGAEYLILKNLGSGSAYVDHIKFKYLSEERDPDTLPFVTIAATNVIEGGEGVGYHGNTANNSNGGELEKSGQNVVLREGGEWVAYDISALDAGIYTMSVTYTDRNDTGLYLDVFVDDELQSKVKPPLTTNTLGGEPETHEFCDVEIKEGSSVLKIRNSSRFVTFITSITLRYKAEERDEAYKIRQYGDHATGKDVDHVLTYESGADYYDAGGKAFVSCLENGILAQNPEDWARYDLSGFKEGTYKVTLNYASKALAHVKLKFDGEILLLKELAATAENYGTYKDAVIGNVFIEEGTQYLIFENLGSGAVYPKYIDFELVSEQQTAWPDIRLGALHKKSYYDAGGADKFEASGQTVCVRECDSVSYDVSEFKAGTYSLSIENSSTSACQIKASVDGMTYLNVPTISTDSYSVYEENYLGQVYIGEDAETITIESTGAAATYIKTIVFNFVSDEDEAAINILLNPQVPYQPDGYMESGVSYYDAGGADNFEKSGSTVVLRAGDWVRYDLESFGLDAGVYNVSIKAQAGSTSALDIEADGTGEKRGAALFTADDVAVDCNIGRLVVGENSKYFTISNNDTVRVMVGTIKITRAQKATEIELYSDEKGKNPIESTAGVTSAYVKVAIVRPDAAAIGENAYVGLYDGGKLKSIHMIPAGKAYDATETFHVDGITETSSIKVLVWDSSNKPLMGETVFDKN